MTPPRERYLRTSEVAKILQVSPKTVARWATEGRLPYRYTLGGHRRYPESGIEDVLRRITRNDLGVHTFPAFPNRRNQVG